MSLVLVLTQMMKTIYFTVPVRLLAWLFCQFLSYFFRTDLSLVLIPLFGALFSVLRFAIFSCLYFYYSVIWTKVKLRNNNLYLTIIEIRNNLFTKIFSPTRNDFYRPFPRTCKAWDRHSWSLCCKLRLNFIFSAVGCSRYFCFCPFLGMGNESFDDQKLWRLLDDFLHMGG